MKITQIALTIQQLVFSSKGQTIVRKTFLKTTQILAKRSVMNFMKVFSRKRHKKVEKIFLKIPPIPLIIGEKLKFNRFLPLMPWVIVLASCRRQPIWNGQPPPRPFCCRKQARLTTAVAIKSHRRSKLTRATSKSLTRGRIRASTS